MVAPARDERESVGGNAASINMALGDLHRAQYALSDLMRAAQGVAVDAFGLGPAECSYEIVASGTHWQLRDYGGDRGSPSLLIVAAPIKRPYIWDLAPSASAIRTCLREKLHVHLLEWMPASPDNAGTGLEECIVAISESVARISRQTSPPVLMGHSLGGTLAAVYAGVVSDDVRALVLLSAPLCFRPANCQFRDTLVSLVPPDLPDSDPFPGSLLSQMSALASPKAFVWERFVDAALSVSDPHAFDIHMRVERWALDEVALPGKLVRQIVDWLYREDRLSNGTLKINGKLVTPAAVTTPVLAVVNTDDEVSPLTSVKPFMDALPTERARIIECPGELGVGLQHLGILVGRQAHARVWPVILDWIKVRD